MRRALSSASIDSEYELVSSDCAGRGLQSDSFCTPGLDDPDQTGFVDASSPGLVDLETACVAGDMIACDFAFEVSPFGSEFERVGESCGGRVPFLTSTSRAQFGAQADD